MMDGKGENNGTNRAGGRVGYYEEEEEDDYDLEDDDLDGDEDRFPAEINLRLSQTLSVGFRYSF